MHHPTYRITHTTAFVTPVVEHWLISKTLNTSMIFKPFYDMTLDDVVSHVEAAGFLSRYLNGPLPYV